MMQAKKPFKYTLNDLSKDIGSVSSKIRFLQHIDQYCLNLFRQNKLNENEYFDEKVFNDAMAVMSQYYQIDPQLKLLFEKRKSWAKL